MLYPAVAVVVGIAALIWSADVFVNGAVAAAKRLGMSQLVIGMVIVGFGTSLPEMLVSALSAWDGVPGIAIGNAYGSNIANITLILGVTALVNPIPVNAMATRGEIRSLILVTAAVIALLAVGGAVTRLDAIMFLVAFMALMRLSMRRGRPTAVIDAAAEVEATPDMPLGKAIFRIVAGLAVLLASSRALVWGATEIARSLGVSELTIGLTVVAVGTSLPELASSLAAARKNHHDIAVGNVIGSNLFNTLAVVGIAGVIRPLTVEPAVIVRDLPAMGAATLILFLLCLPRKGRNPIITRAMGGGLLALYVGYTLWVTVG